MVLQDPVKTKGNAKRTFPCISKPEVSLSIQVVPIFWYFFKLLGDAPDFFKQCTSQRNNDEDYKSAKLNVHDIAVTKDSAERAAKLVTNFLACAKKR